MDISGSNLATQRRVISLNDHRTAMEAAEQASIANLLKNHNVAPDQIHTGSPIQMKVSDPAKGADIIDLPSFRQVKYRLTEIRQRNQQRYINEAGQDNKQK